MTHFRSVWFSNRQFRARPWTFEGENTVRALLICCLMLGCGAVWAQPGGYLEGTVSGESGEALSRANIVVQGTDFPERTGAAAGTDGRFRFAVPAGNYRIEITFIGYKPEIRENVFVQAGRSTTLNVVLKEQVIFLEQSVVSASRRQEKVLEAPASVAVVEGADIRSNPSMNIADHVKNLPAVDFAKTGMANSSIVVRGFNSVFTGTLLMMTDNRFARVPSVRVNAPNFIPITSDDVERIEVVLGPGSALYGPNSADGVMHIITHSPFTSQGTSAHFGYGERSLRQASIRHAGAVGDRVGYKVSARYYTGREWEYTDPEEVRARQRREKEIAADLNLSPLPTRDPDTKNLGLEARLDWRASDNFTAILSAGHNKADLVGLTGVGASQTIDWQYNYAQLRVLYGDWFIQAFRNWTDAGGTFLLRTGTPVVDRSALTVFQTQHTSNLGARQRFTYGLDALMTRPVTDGTIMGKNEDDDDLNEYGGYVQSETALSAPLDLVLALRYDYHNRLAEAELSPRAALVFKPRATQTLRLTYNRAFGTPSTNNLYLDLLSQRDPFGLSPNFTPLFSGLGLGEFKSIDIWAQGTYSSGSDKGLTFRRDGEGRPLFRSPFAPLVAGQSAQLGLAPSDAGYPIGPDGYMAMDHPLVTNVMWGIGRQAVLTQLGPQFQMLATAVLVAQGMGTAEAQAAAGQLAEALPGIVPEQLPGLRNVMGKLNQETKGFDFATADGGPIRPFDVPRIESAITQTIELGYKGVVADKLVVAADLYQSRTEDFVAPLGLETPNVFLEPQSLGAALGAALEQTLADPANADLAGVLAALDQVAIEGVVEGNNNGTPVDEMVSILVSGAARIPYGTVSPEQASDPYAVIASYRNFGEVTIHGLDLSLAYYPADHWRLTGSYSFVDDNFFEDLQLSRNESPGGGADIALNAPQHKAKLGAAYNFAQLGLEVGGRVRYNGSFPMNSGVYVGDVDSYTVVDLNLTYQLPLEPDLVLQVDASNVLNQAYRSFVGAPEVGRLVFGQLGVRF
jgi:iron complex outermembrane receptor protein